MQYEMINSLLNQFDTLIDSLITDLKEFKLDETAIDFLAKRTRNFINSTEITLLNVIFNVLEKTSDVKYNFEEEINISKQIIKKIFEDMNKSLDNILPDEDEEEHIHCYDHNHEHKHHIDVENVQEDIDILIEKLVSLKNIVYDISSIVLLSLKYNNNNIDETEYKTEYDLFKEKIKSYKNEFEN